MIDDEHFQIGEVAERVGLSLRTIRYYEEIGLVAPSGRTEGGFRLYTDADVERLLLVKALKPLGLSLATMADLLEAVDGVSASRSTRAEQRLTAVLDQVRARCDELEMHLGEARAVIRGLSSSGAG